MPTCPKCEAVVSDLESPCPVCGASTGQPTASFAPVEVTSDAPQDAPGTDESPVLVVRKGPQLGERFYLEGSRLTIGRDPDSGIFLNDITVSRSHAVLDMDGSSVVISDSGSLNGTFVNGNYIDSAELNHGDIVQVGTFQMAFFAAKDSRR